MILVLGFERLQAGLEVGQVVAHPDRADPAGGDEDALLAQLVGDADLAVGRVRTSIKTGNPHPIQGRGVRSDRNYFS